MKKLLFLIIILLAIPSAQGMAFTRVGKLASAAVLITATTTASIAHNRKNIFHEKNFILLKQNTPYTRDHLEKIDAPYKNYYEITAYNKSENKIGSMDLFVFVHPEIHIGSLYVHEDERGNGVVRMLMCSIGHFMPKTTEINLTTNTDAMPFYKKLGLVNHYVENPACLKWTPEARKAEMAKFKFEHIDDNTVRVTNR